jgi:hypothetical protein
MNEAGSKRPRVAAAVRWSLVAGVVTSMLVVALAGLTGVAGAGSTAGGSGNVKRVVEVFHVANNTTANSMAKCPSGTRIMSGGFASTGQHARVVAAGPSLSSNGYIGYAYTPPVNINTGVGKEIARITLVALCAPIGKPVVFG